MTDSRSPAMSCLMRQGKVCLPSAPGVPLSEMRRQLDIPLPHWGMSSLWFKGHCVPLVDWRDMWLPGWLWAKLISWWWCLTSTTSCWCGFQPPWSPCLQTPSTAGMNHMNHNQMSSPRGRSFLDCSLTSLKLVSSSCSFWKAVAVTEGDSASFSSTTSPGRCPPKSAFWGNVRFSFRR